jgi:general secretion pathway protein D
MKSIVTASATACLAVLLLSGMSTDESASESKVSESHDTGIPLERLIAIVARKTNKKYLLDPRVNAQIHLVGQDPSSLTYNELLTILQVYGFVAMEGGGYIRVLPDANARQTAQPPITAGQTYPDAQYVTYVIPVKNSPASMLVPILRPLLPQYAHLAAYNCSNTLLIADSFANVKRIETLVKQLDVGEPYKDTACGPASDAHR